MKKVLIITLLIAGSLATFAQTDINRFGVKTEDSVVPVGLEVGSKAPLFEKVDINGEVVNLGELVRKGPVVLFFYRGQWCPVCARYLKSFEDSLSLILDAGVPVIAVTPETSDNAAKTIKKTKSSVTVVTDPDETIMKSYDVLFDVTDNYQRKIKLGLRTDIAENNGHEDAHLPVPATYIVGNDGFIKAVFFDYDYKHRASVGWILHYLGEL